MKLFRNVFLIFFIVFSISFIGISSYIKDTLTGIQNVDIIPNNSEDRIDNRDTFHDNPVNILIAGIADYNLADTIILCNFNPKNESLNFLSIPRDTLYYKDGFSKKINSSYAVKGDSTKKAQSLINEVSGVVNVKIDHFIKVDFEAFKKIIDVIGGVKISVEEDMYYFDPQYEPPLLIDFKKGTYTLNGEDALKYLRYREKTRGDLGRVERQQKFMKTFIAQAVNIKIFNVVDVLKEHVQITMDAEDIINYLTKLYKIEQENINFSTLPGTPKYIDGISFYIHDEVDTEKLIFNIYKF